ncbi:MAG: J domain-containing protein [Verrucomicrobia bacterium]|nr:J domain-containing protein [Verrucomicrobiota bacterium]
MPLDFKDYYKTLGVPRDATGTDIKKAFRKLARQHHPDVARDKKRAEERFKEINEAYEVLGSPENRRKYDELGANWKQGAGFQPPPGWRARAARGAGGSRAEGFEFEFGGTGFSEFFEQFFGRRHGFGDFSDVGGPSRSGGRHAFEGAPGSVRGSDMEGDLLVTLHEALRGGVRSVSVRRTDPRTSRTETHTYKVRIPPGVQDGQRIRLAGKGDPSLSGGVAGDLYLRVRFAAHPDFRARGADVYHDLELAPWEAVLGATIDVPTLDGRVALRIPPGTSHGQQLRVRGRGLPLGRSADRGHLYVTVSIRLPTRLGAAERALWEQLARQSTFRPRAHEQG